MTSTVLLILTIKRSNNAPSRGVYFPQDVPRHVSDEMSDDEYLRYYGVARYSGSVDDKLSMLERDLLVLENRVGEISAG